MKKWNGFKISLSPEVRSAAIFISIQQGILLLVYGIVVFFFHAAFFERVTESGKTLGIPPEHPYFKFIAEEKTILSSQYGPLIAAGVLIALLSSVSLVWLMSKRAFKNS